jgi:cytochrome c oxidase assembly factor CtaG
MTFAPLVILPGAPVRAIWQGLSRPLVRTIARLSWLRPLVRRGGTALESPVFCWMAATLTLVGWHVPDALALGMQSGTWHAIEQGSFLVAGLLFWWPLIQPWPSPQSGPQWWMVLYLFLATLPCDILSGFLVFSERVAYPAYLSASHHGLTSVVGDQQCAGALMWSVITIVYFVAGMILSTRLLSPGSAPHEAWVGREALGRAAARRDSQRGEVV